MAMSTTCASKTSRILLADGVVDRPQLELAGERLLNAVDQRELRVALAGLLDCPRPRESDTDILADEGEQVLVLLGVAERSCRVRLHARGRPLRRPSSDLSGTPSQLASAMIRRSMSISPSFELAPVIRS